MYAEEGEMVKIIMIVDDQKSVHALLGSYFETYFKSSDSEGKSMPQIIGAEDGEQAWRFLAEGIAPNLMIIGHQMPQMDGIWLINKIQAEPQQFEAKIVLFSGNPLSRQARPTGCFFVRKGMLNERKILKLAVEMGIFAA